MANKLKKVFNNIEPTYKGNIRFYDNETAKDFSDALKAVFERGDTSKLSGNAAISWGIESGLGELPLESFDNVKDIVIGPSCKEQILLIKVDGQDVDFKTVSYYLNDSFVIRTPHNFPFETTITFKIDKNIATMHFTPHLEKAVSVEDAFLSIKQIQGLMKLFFKLDESEDLDLRIITDSLDDYYELLDRLTFIEQKFNIQFDIKDINLTDVESHKDLYELCLTVRDNKALRMNAKMDSSDVTVINTQPGINLVKDQPLELTFLNEITYKIWGKTLTLYCAFYVGNAVTKDIIKLDNGNIRIIYGEKETNPMYMAYKVFPTENEAMVELKELMDHKEEYENAKTVEQYAAE